MKLFIFFLTFSFASTYCKTVHEISSGQNEKNTVEAPQLAETKENEIDDFPEPIVLSLGWGCTVALMLQKHNLRYLSYPFDWNRTSFNGLCALLEDNFLDFLNPAYLHPADQNTFIYNSKYAVGFYHDFTNERNSQGIDIVIANWLGAIEPITTKYQRRIKRFFRALNSGHTVYFFRTNSDWPYRSSAANKTRYRKIKEYLMMKQFPNLKFILVALSFDQDYRKDWGMPLVKNFYLGDLASEREWASILKQ